MPRFLAVYTGTPQANDASGWNKLSDAERKEREAAGMKAWMVWGEKHAGAVVEQGGPLGKTKRVGKNGITDIANNLAGYVVVEAASHEEAARMFENHPHFAIFPGEAVEIMPVTSIPEMPDV